MDIDSLILGLIMFALGLVGLLIKSNQDEYPSKSYTGAKFSWSIYMLLTIGAVLVIWALFAE